MDIENPASDEAPGSSVESPAKAYQSVAFRKSQPEDAQSDPPRVGFATPEAAAARCKELNFDDSDMEEHTDSYLYHQRAAPRCKDAGEPEIEDIEDGIKGIGCGKAADAALDPAGIGGDPEDYAQVPPTKTVRRIPVTKLGREQTGGGERASITGGNDGTVPRVPAGAQFVKSYCGHHQKAIDLHDEHAGMLENPAVAGTHEAWQQEDLDRADEMNGMIAELYPEVSFPEADPGALDESPVDPLAKGVRMDQLTDHAISALQGAQEGPRNADLTDDEDDGMRAENGDLGAAVGADEMPYGAGYLQKIAGHCDAGQAMLNAGIKKQEHPKVIDFAEDELGRLEKRKSACKKIMTKNYPDHAGTVFPEAEAEPEAAEKPEAVETKIEDDTDKPAPKSKPKGKEDPDPKKVTDAETETKPEEEDDKKPKPDKKSAPATTTDLLRAVVKGLADLTKSVAARTRPVAAPVAKAASTPVPAQPEPDPETQKQIVQLEKQIAVLIEREKRFQMRIASKIGVNGKKKACECGGACGACKMTSYFTEKDALSAIDESAGAALVPPPKTKADGDKCPKCGQAANVGDDGVRSCEACDTRWNVNDAAKKKYHIAATLKGRAITVKAGHPVPFFAEQWRIEDQTGALFDNRFFAGFKEAEKMLLQLV